MRGRGQALHQQHTTMELNDDGLRSRNNWVSRPIAAKVDLFGVPLHIGNFAAAEQAVADWPQGGVVVNLSLQPVEGKRNVNADNIHAIEDSPAMTADEADDFLGPVADKIRNLLANRPWVLVNCRAGLNRSSAAVLAFLMKHRRMSLREAKKVLLRSKASAARRLRFKSRFQSWEGRTADMFSWPTLKGASSPVLLEGLKRLVV